MTAVSGPSTAADTPTSTAQRLGLPHSKLVTSPLEQQGEANERPQLRLVPDQTAAPTEQHPKRVSDDGPPASDDGAVPPVLRAVHQAFKEADVDRLHTTRLLENEALAGLSAKRLGVLLAACGVQPLSQPFVADGQRGRGYHYSDVATARQRAADGRIRLPDHAFDWSGPDPSHSSP